MEHKIRNIINKGYFNERTEGWTIFDRSTTYSTWAAARAIADKLERKERYYQKVEIIDASLCEERN